jgi:hypothetical protein
MSAIENTPINKNFLNPLNFQFQLKRAPHLNFFIQKINIPSLTLQIIDVPTSFNYLPNAANKVQYGELEVMFKVDEDFQNYLELHNWIRGLGFPEKFEEFSNIAKNPTITGEGLKSDIGLIILNAVKRPNFEISFKEAFPSFLSEIYFDSTMDDVQYVTASATFRYTLFDIKKIS